MQLFLEQKASSFSLRRVGVLNNQLSLSEVYVSSGKFDTVLNCE